MKLPPNIGDRIVIGDWIQFPTTVDCVEKCAEGVVIYVTTKYPKGDPYLKCESDAGKVYLRDEGKPWHRYEEHPKLN